MKIHYFEHYATNNSYWYREHPGAGRDGYVDIGDAQKLFEAMVDIYAKASDLEVQLIAKRAMKAVGGPPTLTEQPEEDEGDG